jgi:hypothetical protein
MIAGPHRIPAENQSGASSILRLAVALDVGGIFTLLLPNSEAPTGQTPAVGSIRSRRDLVS